MKAAALVSVLGLQLAPFADLLERLDLGSYSEDIHARSVADLKRHPGLAERLAERRDRVAETAERDGDGKGMQEGDGEKTEDDKTDYFAAERTVAEWASSQGVSFAAVHTLNETLPTRALFRTPARLAHCQALCAGLGRDDGGGDLVDEGTIPGPLPRSGVGEEAPGKVTGTQPKPSPSNFPAVLGAPVPLDHP